MRYPKLVTRLDNSDPLNYPSGRQKDGETDGTRFNEIFTGDLFANIYAALRYIYPNEPDKTNVGNGLPDNETNGYELKKALAYFLQDKTDWVEFTDSELDNENVVYPGTDYFPLRYRKINGRVEIYGVMYNESNSNGFTLPSGFIPSRQTKAIILDGVTPISTDIITIATSGLVLSQSGNEGLWKINISFPLF